MRISTRLATAAAAALAAVTLAAPAQADPRVGGDIGVRYEAVGGQRGLLGQPVTPEIRTPNGRGAYVVFQGGSIYWSPATGAHEVHGAIRDAWAKRGWEAGPLGFPTSDEYDHLGTRRSDFQGGTLQWTPRDGVVLVGGPAVPGCAVPHRQATPEQAAGCVVRGWELGRADVLSDYANLAVTRELLARPFSAGRADGCTRPAQPVTSTTSGVECVYYIPPRPRDDVQHGVTVYLGIDQLPGTGATVSDVEFIG